MGTAIIVIILVLIVAYTFKSYSKKLKSGCCGGEADVSSIKPKDTDKSHYPYKKKIYIEGMSCANCKKRIENSFHKQDGFYLEISLNEKVGILRTKEIINDDQIKSNIENLGYQVKKIENIA